MRPHLTAGQVDEVREHALAHLRARGPLPTVRIGRQPYGILPIVASRAYRSGSSLETALAGLLASLKPYWLCLLYTSPSPRD